MSVKMEVEIINFRGSAICKYRLYTCKDAFPTFSTILHTGRVYHFASDYACGSWAAVACISGNGNWDNDSFIKKDQVLITQRDLANISGTVTEFKKNFLFQKTVRQMIQESLKKGNLNKSVHEIQELFSLSDGRIDRPISQSSGEVFNITLACQYAMGKKIISFPWISEFELNRIEGCWTQIEVLKKNDILVLIPSSPNEFLKSSCDGHIHFSKNGVKVW